MSIDLGTLAGIINSMKQIEQVVWPCSFKSSHPLSEKLKALDAHQYSRLCLALASLKDHCRVLSLSTIEPAPQSVVSPTQTPLPESRDDTPAYWDRLLLLQDKLEEIKRRPIPDDEIDQRLILMRIGYMEHECSEILKKLPPCPVHGTSREPQIKRDKHVEQQ